MHKMAKGNLLNAGQQKKKKGGEKAFHLESLPSTDVSKETGYTDIRPSWNGRRLLLY